MLCTTLLVFCAGVLQRLLPSQETMTIGQYTAVRQTCRAVAPDGALGLCLVVAIQMSTAHSRMCSSGRVQDWQSAQSAGESEVAHAKGIQRRRCRLSAADGHFVKKWSSGCATQAWYPVSETSTDDRQPPIGGSLRHWACRSG